MAQRIISGVRLPTNTASSCWSPGGGDQLLERKHSLEFAGAGADGCIFLHDASSDLSCSGCGSHAVETVTWSNTPERACKNYSYFH